MHAKEISASSRLLNSLDVVVLILFIVKLDFDCSYPLIVGFMYLFLYILGESPIEAGLLCNHGIPPP